MFHPRMIQRTATSLSFCRAWVRIHWMSTSVPPSCLLEYGPNHEPVGLSCEERQETRRIAAISSTSVTVGGIELIQ